MRKILGIFLVSILFLASVSIASAAPYGGAPYGNCQPIYGGGETCAINGNIVVDKTVRNPENGQFVDNLGLNDPRYVGGQTVTFQITVMNTGDASIPEATIQDVFPSYVSNVSGPGSFDSASNTLTFKLTNLSAGESRNFTVTGQLVDSSKLPLNQGVTCLVNQAIAKADNQQSTDNSQFCVEKTVQTTKGGLPVMTSVPMKETPATGPEALTLIGLIPAGLSGFLLRRRSTKI